MDHTYSRGIAVLRTTFLTIVGVFTIFPLIWLIIGSLKTRHDALALPPRLIFTPVFDAYNKILAGGVLNAFANSLTIGLTNVVLALAIGVPAAYALSRMHGRVQENLSFWVLSIRMAPLFSVILPLYILWNTPVN